MHQPETAAAVLRQFKAMGMSIAIDDFGTGYSSLAYLHKFPIDTLKIDRSFIKGLEEGSENFEIVSSIVPMARRLSMDVVAEGIEMPSQVEILENLGCRLGQGYLFAKLVIEKESAQLLRGSRRRLVPPEIAPSPCRYRDEHGIVETVSCRPHFSVVRPVPSSGDGHESCVRQSHR